MKPIRGYENYSVTEDGRVYNKKGKLKHSFKNEYGYHIVTLFKNNKQKSMRVARLVAIAYIDNPLSLPEVNHKDGNKDNNHYSNLEWCTRSHNTKHAWNAGLNKGNTR